MTKPGSEKVVKAGFVVLDGTTGVILKIIVFQYNPETLVRRLDGTDASTAPIVTTLPGETVPIGTPGPVAPPHESVSFTITLDAADKLELGDAVTQQNGIFPALSALELLMYPEPNTLTVWVSGSRRVLPVRINELVFNEQAFDPLLNPIRAEVSVSLQILKDSDLAANSRGRAIWDAYFLTLQQLAQALGNAPLSALGITGI
jgi:hypothetical protein